MMDKSSKAIEGYAHLPSERTTATAAYNSRRNSLSHYRSRDDQDPLAVTAGDFTEGQTQRNTLEHGAKLRELRENRRQIEQKFLRITTRMNFMKKKEGESLRHAIEAKNKLQSIYTRKHKRMSEQRFKEELDEKRRFQEWKKNQQVEHFRNNLQLTRKLMVESMQKRKFKDVEIFRGRRYSQRQELNRRKDLSLMERQQYHDKVLEMHEKQAVKKKLLEYGRRLNCNDNLDDRIEHYEQQAQRAYKFIEALKKEEAELGRVNQQSSDIFKSIMEDFNRLKKS